MPDIDQNVTIDITGNTASIATDYTTSGVTNAHVQIVKLAFGSETTATRVTTSAPLPVDIRASNATVGITGSVGGLGDFKVRNATSGNNNIPIIVSGITSTSYPPVQINGTVQGITNGILAGITGTITARDNLRIQGLTSGYPIAITGGRPLTSGTDTVGVTGTVTISGGRYLGQTTDNVRIFAGSDGATLIPVVMRDSYGNLIGSSGGALNVNLIGAGITATVSVSTLIGICQPNQTVPLFIAGGTAGPAVRIKGSFGGSEAVEVGWNSPQTVKTSSGFPLDVNVNSVIAAINTLRDGKLTDIEANTAIIEDIYTRINSNTNGINANIISFTRPGSVFTGRINVTTATLVLPSQTLKTGVTLKTDAANTSNIIIRGAGSAEGYPLGIGETLFIETNNLNTISVSATTTGILYYIAS